MAHFLQQSHICYSLSSSATADDQALEYMGLQGRSYSSHHCTLVSYFCWRLLQKAVGNSIMKTKWLLSYEHKPLPQRSLSCFYGRYWYANKPIYLDSPWTLESPATNKITDYYQQIIDGINKQKLGLNFNSLMCTMMCSVCVTGAGSYTPFKGRSSASVCVLGGAGINKDKHTQGFCKLYVILLCCVMLLYCFCVVILCYNIIMLLYCCCCVVLYYVILLSCYIVLLYYCCVAIVLLYCVVLLYCYCCVDVLCCCIAVVLCCIVLCCVIVLL